MSRPDILFLARRARIGCVAGLVGGFAIFLSIFVIDLSLGSPPGTFYKVVGLPLGLDGLGATLTGMILHMLTAALIGTVFGMGSCAHRMLDVHSIKKGSLAGIVTGLVVFAVFFMPLTNFVMLPQIRDSASEGAAILIPNTEMVFVGALELHVVYGLVMGAFFAIAVQQESRRQITVEGI